MAKNKTPLSQEEKEELRRQVRERSQRIEQRSKEINQLNNEAFDLLNQAQERIQTQWRQKVSTQLSEGWVKTN